MGYENKTLLHNLMHIMNTFEYSIESWDFLVEMWNECIKNNEANLINNLSPFILECLNDFYPEKVNIKKRLRIKELLQNFKHIPIENLGFEIDPNNRLYNGSRAMYNGNLKQAERLLFPSIERDILLNIRDDLPRYYDGLIGHYYFFQKQWEKAFQIFAGLSKESDVLQYRNWAAICAVFADNLDYFLSEFEYLCKEHSFFEFNGSCYARFILGFNCSKGNCFFI